MSTLQAFLIAIYYALASSPIPFASVGNWATFNRPLVAGLFIGIIMGNPTQGVIMGAVITTMYLGATSIGGSISSDPGKAGTFGIAIALACNLTDKQALSIAIPIGAIGSLFWSVALTVQCAIVPLATKCIDKGDTKGLIIVSDVLPMLGKSLVRFTYTFLILYFLTPVFSNFINSLDTRILDALSVAGGMLPALGIGMMLNVIYKGKTKIIFFLGFLLAAYFKLSIIAIALIFLCISLFFADIHLDSDNLDISKDDEDDFKLINKKDLIKGWLNWIYFGESSYNYERMQGFGFASALSIPLNKIYKGDEKGKIESLKQHSRFYMCETNFGGLIYGITTAMEEQKKLDFDINDETIESVKVGLMAPLSNLGETILQTMLMPILSVVFMNFSLKGYLWSPVLYTLIFEAIYYGFGYFLLMIGYRKGAKNINALLRSGSIDELISVAKSVAGAVAGAMIFNFVIINWNICIYDAGILVFDLQSQILDTLVPGISSLLLTLFIYKMLNKKCKTSWLMLGIVVVASVLAYFGIIV